MKKKILLILILLLFFTSTSVSTDIQPKIKVGVSLMSNQAFFKVMLEAIKEEVEVKLNGTLMVSYAGHSITKQIADVEEMIDNEIDFLLFNAVDSEAAEPAIVIAKNAGIPVVCLDVDAVGPRDIYIGSDNYQAGVLCGEYIVERLQGKGKVAILNGNPVSSVRMRYNGFIDVIKKNPDIKIIAEENGDGDFIKSVDATELVLENHKKIDAIYAINDPSALGALAAVEVANRQKGLFIVGIDGSPDAVQAVLNNTAFAATAAQDPAKIGQLGVKYGLKLLVQEKVPNTFPVKVKLIRNDNAKGFSW